MLSLPERIKKSFCAAMLCTAALVPVGIEAGTIEGPEYAVKKGFVYNFIALTKWPGGSFNHSAGRIVLCVVPDNPATDTFLTLNNMAVQGKPIFVKKADAVPVEETVHALFVAAKEPALVQKSLQAVAGQPVLTIGEADGFIEMGGIINLIKKEDHLLFTVNSNAARQAQLKLGSRIFMSADSVTGAGR